MARPTTRHACNKYPVRMAYRPRRQTPRRTGQGSLYGVVRPTRPGHPWKPVQGRLACQRVTMVPTPTLTVGRPVLSRGGLLSYPRPAVYGGPGPYVYDAQSARHIPAVGRALGLYAGLCKQMPMEAYRGYGRIEPTPRILTRPDPMNGGPWFVQVNVEDYLLNGNALSLVTQRGADGWPLSVMWLPVNYVTVSYDPTTGVTTYNYLGEALPIEDVIHVKRGADRNYPVRGIGVVEEYLATLDRIAMEEESERGALDSGGVPSVAVITPQPTLNQDVADEAKANWMDKFGGPVREPVILPNGTVVQPLAWSPTDTQLVEARHMSLIDVANMFNLDAYWLSAPGTGLTYKTAAPQYQQVLRTSLEPVLADFEDVWADAWLPRGQQIRFQRSQLLREDLATSTMAAVSAYGAGIISQPEARVMIGLPPATFGAVGTGADIGVASPDDPDTPPDPNADDTEDEDV